MSGHRMSWQYIAGFFDGEGNLHASRRGFQWSIAQSKDKGLMVLQEIKQFLAGYGVDASIYVAPCGRHAIHSLYVTNRAALLIVLPRILPFLHVKEPEIQDTLRHIKLFPLRCSGPLLGMRIHEGRAKGRSNAGDRHGKSKLRSVQVLEIKERLRLGERVVDVAHQFGVHPNTIHGIKRGKSWSCLNTTSISTQLSANA